MIFILSSEMKEIWWNLSPATSLYVQGPLWPYSKTCRNHPKAVSSWAVFITNTCSGTQSTKASGPSWTWHPPFRSLQEFTGPKVANQYPMRRWLGNLPVPSGVGTRWTWVERGAHWPELRAIAACKVRGKTVGPSLLFLSLICILARCSGSGL